MAGHEVCHDLPKYPRGPKADRGPAGYRRRPAACDLAFAGPALEICKAKFHAIGPFPPDIQQVGGWMADEHPPNFGKGFSVGVAVDLLPSFRSWRASCDGELHRAFVSHDIMGRRASVRSEAKAGASPQAPRRDRRSGSGLLEGTASDDLGGSASGVVVRPDGNALSDHLKLLG